MPEPRSPFTAGAAVRRQAVLTGALVALAVIALLGIAGHAPLAGMLLSAELLVLAALRLLLPTRAVGALAVRSRLVDVVCLVALGIAIGALTGSPNL